MYSCVLVIIPASGYSYVHEKNAEIDFDLIRINSIQIRNGVFESQNIINITLNISGPSKKNTSKKAQVQFSI